MKTKKVKLNEIKVDQDIYPRVHDNWITIAKYKSSMESGSKFPPICVALFKNKYYLIDGLHRMKALKSLKQDFTQAEVLTGLDKKKMFIQAVSRNTAHGQPYTSQDLGNIVLDLKKFNLSIDKISQIINMPVRQIAPFMVKRTARISIGNQTKEIILKKPLMHLAGRDLKVSTEEEQAILHGKGQIALLDEFITLLANNWLNFKDKEVVEKLKTIKGYLYKVLKGRG